MSTTTPLPSKPFSPPTSANPAKHPEMSIRRPSQTNYADAQRAVAALSQSSVAVPDGRRNSQGEELESPVAAWSPTFERTQSWNQQDRKREEQRAMLERGEKTHGFSER